MKTKLTCALAGALAIGVLAAPAANAGTVCTTAGNAMNNKYVSVSELFETANVQMSDEAAFVLRTACENTP
jgi:hypothetical protein